MLFKSSPSKRKLYPSNMSAIEWFALTKGYGDGAYGAYHATYKMKRALELFDLGRTANRDHLIHELVEKNLASASEARNLLNPDYQYSGSHANLKVHEILQKLLKPQGYDGTYINRSKAHPNHPLSGPSEVVLWANIPSKLKLTNVI